MPREGGASSCQGFAIGVGTVLDRPPTRAMTAKKFVMAGFMPAIHVFLA
jgi:hypothetical protein